MRSLYNLTKRNCLVFLRDLPSVFFSLLSMLIVLMLMGVFLGNMNVENITDLLQQYGGTRDAILDKEHATHLVQYWTLAGILVVNSLTVTLSVIGTLISDRVDHRLQSFYTSPISKNVIALSYILSAIIIGSVFCLLTLGISLLYIVLTGGEMLTLQNLLKIILYIFINVCGFSAMMFLVAQFVKTNSAWSGMATIVGTLVGFIGAIYLPLGSLPNTVGNVLKYTSVFHGTSLMRKVCCEQMLQKTFADTPAELIDTYQQHMGITVQMGDKMINSQMQIIFLLCTSLVVFAMVVFVMKKKRMSDR